jgi:hypothetical protein
MKINPEPALAVLKRWKLKGWSVCGIALLCFAAGSLVTARLMHANQLRADSNRVFELMVYHTAPGKVPALESIFRDVSKMQTKYNIDVVGYWVPNAEGAVGQRAVVDDPMWDNTFIYVVAHPSLDEAKKNWHALHVDPAFPPYRDQAAQILEKVNGEYRVDEVYMRPTDFSALK